MPKPEFVAFLDSDETRDLGAIDACAERFDVSLDACLIRISELGLLGRGSAFWLQAHGQGEWRAIKSLPRFEPTDLAFVEVDSKGSALLARVFGRPGIMGDRVEVRVGEDVFFSGEGQAKWLGGKKVLLVCTWQ
jgi:hypothetical protein